MNATALPAQSPWAAVPFRSVRNRDVSPAAPTDGFTAVRNGTAARGDCAPRREKSFMNRPADAASTPPRAAELCRNVTESRFARRPSGLASRRAAAAVGMMSTHSVAWNEERRPRAYEDPARRLSRPAAAHARRVRDIAPSAGRQLRRHRDRYRAAEPAARLERAGSGPTSNRDLRLRLCALGRHLELRAHQRSRVHADELQRPSMATLQMDVVWIVDAHGNDVFGLAVIRPTACSRSTPSCSPSCGATPR